MVAFVDACHESCYKKFVEDMCLIELFARREEEKAIDNFAISF